MNINTVSDFRRAYRNGPYAWPGGYPLFFITDDGDALSFDAVKDNLRSIIDAIANKHSDGWRVIALDINYEDQNLYCAHTDKRIPAAYED